MALSLIRGLVSSRGLFAGEGRGYEHWMQDLAAVSRTEPAGRMVVTWTLRVQRGPIFRGRAIEGGLAAVTPRQVRRAFGHLLVVMSHEGSVERLSKSHFDRKMVTSS
jgi:hypothetical protein